ncbi:hypothetical protein ET475_09955 [Microbacterium protaetiae]|uniref:Uncharacterized protein n=1 Tax=Microbacterium protaetiae TaxID=2509458 RepID=A0A4P6EES4_9MICO|nr:hypothetical protein [Microbacterium protaetiae]QAY60276.1 hypothetical protein ET475_09955 [Microbacterium protaetiae]
MSDTEVLLEPSLAAYEADVAFVAQAVLDDASVRQYWPRAAEELADGLAAIDVVVRTPDRSLDGQIALQQLVRLSIDAAMVVAHALDEDEQPSREFIRDILAGDRIDLQILDQGLGTAWTKIRAFVDQHPLAATAAFIGLVGVALVVAGTVVAFTSGVAVTGAAIGFGLQLTGAVADAAGTVLGLADAVVTGADVDHSARLDSIDAAAVAPGSTIVVTAGEAGENPDAQPHG